MLYNYGDNLSGFWVVFKRLLVSLGLADPIQVLSMGEIQVKFNHEFFNESRTFFKEVSDEGDTGVFRWFKPENGLLHILAGQKTTLIPLLTLEFDSTRWHCFFCLFNFFILRIA